ncbi:MAG: hypothetical protein AAF682_15120 [Planctomycetota bacterium]
MGPVRLGWTSSLVALALFASSCTGPSVAPLVATPALDEAPYHSFEVRVLDARDPAELRSGFCTEVLEVRDAVMSFASSFDPAVGDLELELYRTLVELYGASQVEQVKSTRYYKWVNCPEELPPFKFVCCGGTAFQVHFADGRTVRVEGQQGSEAVEGR